MANNDSPTPITILWATQTGRAKACARRTIRLLHSVSHDTLASDIHTRGRCAFDDIDFLSLGSQQQQQQQLLILFVSTTGDAEQPSTIQNTWSKLLSKSLPHNLYSNVKFALFALGDRAYGPDAFCAAGRKLAARLVQLGARPVCALGYGDDGSLNGGVFADLDVWLEGALFPVLRRDNAELVVAEVSSGSVKRSMAVVEDNLPYEVTVIQPSNRSSPYNYNGEIQEWQQREFSQHYCKYFQHGCPTTAYQYNDQLGRTTQQKSSSNIPNNNNAPLLGRVTVNKRITADDWMQNTRHIKICITQSMDKNPPTTPGNDCQTLPYQAGDVATILPSNPSTLVDHFISVLPLSIRRVANATLHIQHTPNHSTTTMNHPWPTKCTLRGLLFHCADLQSLPEREDLFALSRYCKMRHPEGKDQRNKLISLSETSGAALYGDYIVREKRNWADLFYDFDSVRWEEKRSDDRDVAGHSNGEGRKLTISDLLTLLPSMAPRHFSIASSPSFSKLESSTCNENEAGFEIELCVAVVEGDTPRGRPYVGCCSGYLASIEPGDTGAVASDAGDTVRLWIHPGSFSKLPLNPLNVGQGGASSRYFETPVMCVGAGTGVAPLRSLILEREAQRMSNIGNASPSNGIGNGDDDDNILVFGCRKRSKDYYYSTEWENRADSNRLRTIPAFSRDQKHKLYVQRALREADDGELIARHLLERGGAVYIAGGSKMARAVKDEIVEALGARLDGGEKDAKRLLNKLKRKGLFSIEAW
eukprot:CAMPEP_0201643010 /NCGR_PEP_ID=MMETSP0493-20130528/27377_1 /ASSEMBLY_ACC=CAM_ASM_000838 /TAXON_ID=420259 /ORGANISM="Thalassiosira gravida, Strain GMp14c1" /LENGTH=757 /DNA_ID=CAMNT_0048117335 /DNA_START=81 /DNA_END=2351 /DNA_ORIENTATION=+